MTGESQIYNELDRVGTLHPIFVIPEGVAEKTRAYFASKGGFQSEEDWLERPVLRL
jgi:protein farnesyltransferase subunit beta